MEKKIFDCCEKKKRDEEVSSKSLRKFPFQVVRSSNLVALNEKKKKKREKKFHSPSLARQKKTGSQCFKLAGFFFKSGKLFLSIPLFPLSSATMPFFFVVVVSYGNKKSSWLDEGRKDCDDYYTIAFNARAY